MILFIIAALVAIAGLFFIVIGILLSGGVHHDVFTREYIGSLVLLFWLIGLGLLLGSYFLARWGMSS